MANNEWKMANNGWQQQNVGSLSLQICLWFLENYQQSAWTTDWLMFKSRKALQVFVVKWVLWTKEYLIFFKLFRCVGGVEFWLLTGDEKALFEVVSQLNFNFAVYNWEWPLFTHRTIF